MRKNWALITVIFFLILAIIFISKKSLNSRFQIQNSKLWQIQSIDTVKYSRDMASQHLNNPSFDSEIENQVKKIAETGATHIALGTPYDERFVPFLKRWVNISRKYGLKIWFRGNFSGWEEWFNEKLISRDEHKKLLEEFIKNNGDLFADGDYFTSCTECENGGEGDPRKTGDVEGFRQFLIDEYLITKSQFRLIGKNVYSNYFPMNYDVATLIMDKDTTTKLGGIVVIDHYVDTPEKTSKDASILAEKSGGKIVIGEFGAPIPDIHGEMSQSKQAEWIDKTLSLLYENKNVVGVNYWTGFGGSTKLWNDDGTNRQAVEIIAKYYNPKLIKGYVIDETGKPINNVELTTNNISTSTNKYGQFILPILENGNIDIVSFGYYRQQAHISTIDKIAKITLKKINPDFWYNLQKVIHSVILVP